MELNYDLTRRESEGFLDWAERLILYVEEKKNNNLEYDWQDVYFALINKTVSQTEARKRCYMLRDLLPILRVEGITNLEGLFDEDEDYKDEEFESNEEARTITFLDFGAYYEIKSRKRTIKVSKEKVRDIKQAYCGDTPLTINQITRRFNIPRRDFFLIKNAFNITHDDVPFLDEDIDNSKIDSLVDDTLEKRKEKYFIKLEQKEIDDLRKENKLYRDKDYLFTKTLKEVNSIKFDTNVYKVREYNYGTSEAILDIADWHIGMLTNNYWNVYNLEIAKERMNDLVDYVIKYGVMHNIKTLHVNDLGDQISGIIHENLVAENEIDVVQQVKEWVEILGNALIKLSSVFKEVKYYNVSGNHSRIFPNKNTNGDKDYFERLIPWTLSLKLSSLQNMEFMDNKIDDSIIVNKIFDFEVYGVHGHLDKFNKVAQDLSMMISKPREIHMGHLHNEKLNTVHGVKVYISDSGCGVDNYAKNNRYSGGASQSMHIYNEDGTKAVYNFPLN